MIGKGDSKRVIVLSGVLSGDGSGSNPPLCAQAHADMGDGRNVYVLLLVGTHKAGIKGRPAVWSVSVDDHGKDKSPTKLNGLAAALRK